MLLIDWIVTLSWWQIVLPLVWLVGAIYSCWRSWNDDDNPLLEVTVVVTALLIMFTFVFSSVSWGYIWPMWAMAGLWAAVAGAVFMGGALILRVLFLAGDAKSALTQSWAERNKRLARMDKAIRKRAVLYVSELLGLGVDQNMRELIVQVRDEILEGQLLRRAQLSRHIQAMQLDLDRADVHTVFPEDVRARLDKNLATMREMLDATEREINEILLFLDTVESDLRLVQSEESRRVQVEALFTELIGRYRKQLTDQAEAIHEVEALSYNAKDQLKLLQ